jgi:hypothetical protein
MECVCLNGKQTQRRRKYVNDTMMGSNKIGSRLQDTLFLERVSCLAAGTRYYAGSDSHGKHHRKPIYLRVCEQRMRWPKIISTLFLLWTAQVHIDRVREFGNWMNLELLSGNSCPIIFGPTPFPRLVLQLSIVGQNILIL